MADEEARARATLAEMYRRIQQGAPHTTLDIDADASPELVRSSFLELTKQFHPARFGRMANDVQRLSNEVFLGIKAAHDAMMRALGVATRGTAGRIASGALPALDKSKPPTGQTAPLPRVGTQPARAPSPAVPRTITARAGTPTRQGAAPTGHTPPQGVRPGTPPHGVRPGTPPHGVRPGTPPFGVRSGTPPFGVRVEPRPSTPRDPAAPVAPLADTNTARGIAVPVQRTAPVFDEQAELKQALDHMTAKNWVGARNVLHGLAARVPASKQYRALLCYTRGREAQAAGKGEEAAMELQRALQLDPDLSLAKTALAELLRRR